VNKEYYTLLWVPRTGLHYTQGHFFDGQMATIPFNGTIHLYPSKPAAMAERKRQEEKWLNVKGEFVILHVKVNEHEEEGD
jgi:hypothetical protein